MGDLRLRRTRYQQEALWAVLIQLPIVIILSPLIGILQGMQPAASFVAGGLLCVLPNFYLYRRVFSHQGARAAKKIYKSLCVGQMVKVLLTAIGFFLAVLTEWVLPLWLFIGYIVAQLSFALAPFITSCLNLKNN